MMSPEINMVGLYNYQVLFGDTNFIEVLINTLIFGVSTTFASITIGLFLAVLVESIGKHGRILETLIFSPYVTTMVAVSIVWSWIFEPNVGILNYVLSFINLGPFEWLRSADTAMLSVVIVTVWKQIGWVMIFYISAIKKISGSVIEASKVDGANEWNIFWKIKVPLISPTTYFLTIVLTINSLQAYDQIQVLTQGGPAGATRTLLYYFYQEAFGSFNVGKASAVVIVLAIVTVILTVIESYISKSNTHY